MGSPRQMPDAYESGSTYRSLVDKLKNM